MCVCVCLQEEDAIRLDLEELAKEAVNNEKQLETVEQSMEKAKETLSQLQEEAAGSKVFDVTVRTERLLWKGGEVLEVVGVVFTFRVKLAFWGFQKPFLRFN